MRYLAINGRTYVLGLWWQATELPGQSKVLREARARAETTPDRYDCVTLLPRQFGLGKTEPGKQPAAHSLAASLRPPHESYLGVFHIEGVGWWVFAVRHGLISAEGDRLCATRDEATSHANSLKDLGPFKSEEVFADATEALAAIGRQLAPRQGLFDRGRPLLPLNDDAQRTRRRRAVVVVALALLLGGYGVKHWLDLEAEAKRRAALAEIAAARQATRRAALASAERYFLKTWLKQPSPVDRMAQCMPAMLGLPINASGWSLDGAICAENVVTASWAHQPGASFTSAPLGARIDAQKAASRLTLPAVSAQAQEAPLLGADDIAARLYQLTQDAAAKLRLSWNPPEKKKVEDVEIAAPWASGQWEASNVPPAVLADLSFARALQLPGLVLQSVEYRGGVWTVKGVVHASQQASRS